MATKKIFLQIIKAICLLQGILLASHFVSGQKPGANIIENCQLQKDAVVEGAKGILVTFKYDFSSVDSLQFDPFKSAFKIVIQVLEGEKPVKLNNTYSPAIARNSFSLNLANVAALLKDTLQQVTQFIPYASLQLPAGERNIKLRAVFSGHDAYGQKYMEVVQPQPITVNILPTRLFSLVVNSIEVNSFNEKGQAWDYSLFKTSAPDLKLTLFVGSALIASMTVKDSYIFGEKKSFKTSCLISAGDELRLLLVDRDLTVDDIIINWRITTADLVPATNYYISGAVSNIKSSSIQYAVQ